MDSVRKHATLEWRVHNYRNTILGDQYFDRPHMVVHGAKGGQYGVDIKDFFATNVPCALTQPNIYEGFCPIAQKQHAKQHAPRPEPEEPTEPAPTKPKTKKRKE